MIKILLNPLTQFLQLKLILLSCATGHVSFVQDMRINWMIHSGKCKILHRENYRHLPHLKDLDAFSWVYGDPSYLDHPQDLRRGGLLERGYHLHLENHHRLQIDHPKSAFYVSLASCLALQVPDVFPALPFLDCPHRNNLDPLNLPNPIKSYFSKWLSRKTKLINPNTVFRVFKGGAFSPGFGANVNICAN